MPKKLKMQMFKKIKLLISANDIFPMASPNKSLTQVLQATLHCTKKYDDWYMLKNLGHK